ncbi:MAG TPA: aminoacyl-tRNA hydrolase [Tepidisphaeraceae bacterium]|jgi:PTH1 family peptidyl-tRNA hydrolase
MKLVVGLGNPGPEYSKTRHNVGFEVIDRLATRLGWAKAGDFDRVARTKFDGLMYDGLLGSEKLALLKPTTYMNLSGRSVQSALAFYQLMPADLMIVLDDVALPVGKIRIRPGGSSGGHNGLKDIERALGTNQYPRLRIGIDAPPPRVPQRDYVLGRFSEDQKKLIESAYTRAGDAIVMWIEKGLNPAMNVFNAEEKI